MTNSTHLSYPLTNHRTTWGPTSGCISCPDPNNGRRLVQMIGPCYTRTMITTSSHQVRWSGVRLFILLVKLIYM